jgi:hypothetical protein
LRESQCNREQYDESEEENHPGSVGSLGESAEQSKRVRRECNGDQRRGRPAEEMGQRVGEKSSRVAEGAGDVSAVTQHRDALHRESAREENRKQYENNSDELATKCGAPLVTAIALGQVRVG